MRQVIVNHSREGESSLFDYRGERNCDHVGFALADKLEVFALDRLAFFFAVMGIRKVNTISIYRLFAVVDKAKFQKRGFVFAVKLNVLYRKRCFLR